MFQYSFISFIALLEVSKLLRGRSFIYKELTYPPSKYDLLANSVRNQGIHTDKLPDYHQYHPNPIRLIYQ